jgi:hypothetical protein
MTDCPFKVGDRVQHTPMKTYYTDAFGVSYVSESPSPWPQATVTKVTVDGFDYQYDEPYFMGARIGTMTGGTAFPNGYYTWMLTPKA